MVAAKTLATAFIRTLVLLRDGKCHDDAAYINAIIAQIEASGVINATIRRPLNDWSDALEKEKRP